MSLLPGREGGANGRQPCRAGLSRWSNHVAAGGRQYTHLSLPSPKEAAAMQTPTHVVNVWTSLLSSLSRPRRRDYQPATPSPCTHSSFTRRVSSLVDLSDSAPLPPQINTSPSVLPTARLTWHVALGVAFECGFPRQSVSFGVEDTRQAPPLPAGTKICQATIKLLLCHSYHGIFLCSRQQAPTPSHYRRGLCY